LQLSANIAVIALCILVGWLAVGKGATTGGTGEPPRMPPVYRTGDAIDVLPGVDLAAASRTLVMVLREDCHYCQESLQFYQRLSQARAKRPVKDLRIIVASTDARDALAEYLKSKQVDVDQVVTVAAGLLKVPGTPSLLLVDPTGKILNFWRGKLPAQQEEEALRTLGLASAE
jgi:thioredoxin-related protein